MREALSRIEERHPWLARGLGGPLAFQVPALAASVLTHLLLLGALATAGYAVNRQAGRGDFGAAEVEAPLPDLDRMDATELAETDAPTTLEPVAGSYSPTVSALIQATPPPSAEPPEAMLDVDQATLAPRVIMPTAARLGQVVSIKGNGAEHVGGVEGAVDRLALEILLRLQEGRTLVVWAFDASNSLQAERERLAGYIREVYGHVLGRSEAQAAGDDALLTMVVAFGKDRKALLEEPTVDPAAIAEAIGRVPADESGVESTFQTVADAARRWGKYRRDKQPYRLMIIVVTDEVGDDEPRLEEAIATANAAKAPVYVLGSPAVFGRPEGYMDYTDPKTKQTYFGLPVRQGPESVAPEQIRLPFWYDGPQYAVLDAGFGPFALSRLAGATGGIYFVTRMGQNRPSFDPVAMVEYRPDWVGRGQYEAAVGRHPLRQAVLMAAQITQRNNLPRDPALTFPSADSPEFKEAMEQNQELVYRIQYTVDEALEPIAAAAKFRDRETSRRWQAHYDLIRGRLLAMKLRCVEYNYICAQMKRNPTKFARPESNAWRLVPVEKIESSEKANAAAEEARALLRRVVEEHRGTPWALLAQRELKDPFGFQWSEAKVPPPPKPSEVAAAAARRRAMAKNAPAAKPPEPPKL